MYSVPRLNEKRVAVLLAMTAELRIAHTYGILNAHMHIAYNHILIDTIAVYAG